MSLPVWSVPPEVLAGELACELAGELAVAAAGAVVVIIFVVIAAVEVTTDAALDVKPVLDADTGNVVTATATPRPNTSELSLQSHPVVP